MTKRYVRLTPYDARIGALCRRYMVGGCLFKENQWYELDADWADRLEPLKQDRGARVFQILSAEDYGATVRAELAAAYMRGGVSVAMAGALAGPAPGAPPKTGARQSAFSGLADAADEASIAGAESNIVKSATVTPRAPTPPTAPPPAPDAVGVVSVSGTDDATPTDGDNSPDSPADADGEGEDEVVDVDTIRTHAEADAIGERYGVDLSSARTVSDKRDMLAAELFTAGDDDDDKG